MPPPKTEVASISCMTAIGTLWIVEIVVISAIGTLYLRQAGIGVTGRLSFGELRPEQFYLTAFRAGPQIQLQRAIDQIGDVAQYHTIFAQLQLLTPKELHRALTPQAFQLPAHSFSTAPITPSTAEVSTVSIRPLS